VAQSAKACHLCAETILRPPSDGPADDGNADDAPDPFLIVGYERSTQRIPFDRLEIPRCDSDGKKPCLPPAAPVMPVV
jgi:hypothetical protein